MRGYYTLQLVYVSVSVIVATLAVIFCRFLSLYIFKMVAEKKKELVGNIAHMKASLSLLERARNTIVEYANKYTITTQKRGYKGFTKKKTANYLEASILSYKCFLKKPEGYYEGTGLLTLLRLKKFERRFFSLQRELASAQTLVVVLKKKDFEK